MIRRWCLCLAVLSLLAFRPSAYSCIALPTLGDRVWNDWNADGIQDQGEPGMSGIEVKLYDSAENPFGSTLTNNNGNFSFAVPADEYYLKFILPDGYLFSPMEQESDSLLDSNAHPFTGMTGGITLASGDSDPTWDAGMHAVPLPGTVWLLGTGLMGLFGFRTKTKK